VLSLTAATLTARAAPGMLPSTGADDSPGASGLNMYRAARIIPRTELKVSLTALAS
jgi:hypothetical protein